MFFPRKTVFQNAKMMIIWITLQLTYCQSYCSESLINIAVQQQTSLCVLLAHGNTDLSPVSQRHLPSSFPNKPISYEKQHLQPVQGQWPIRPKPSPGCPSRDDLLLCQLLVCLAILQWWTKLYSKCFLGSQWMVHLNTLLVDW